MTQIRLSEYPEYLAAVPAAATGDYALARSSLVALISRIESAGDPSTHAFVVLKLADVEARTGNSDLGLSLHEEALLLDDLSPLLRILCAKDLIRSFDRPDLASARIDEAETLLLSAWSPASDDMSRGWYEGEIASLREAIRGPGCT